MRGIGISAFPDLPFCVPCPTFLRSLPDLSAIPALPFCVPCPTFLRSLPYVSVERNVASDELISEHLDKEGRVCAATLEARVRSAVLGSS